MNLLAFQRELYLSERKKFTLIIALTLLPIASFMLLVFFISFSPVFSRMENIVEKIFHEMKPLHHLEVSVLESVMPPNDFLIHGLEIEKKYWEEAKKKVDDAFIETLEKEPNPIGRKQLDQMRTLWESAKKQGDDIFKGKSPGHFDNEMSIAMETFDSDIYKLSGAVRKIFHDKEKLINQNYQRIKALKIWGIGFTFLAIFLGVVFGVAGSIWLTRDRKKMIDLSMYDSLTGIYNRHSLEKELSVLQKNRIRFSPPCFSILMIDIDNFKHVNDTYGHDAGDAVLKKYALTTKQMIRDKDVFGRFGGEEFLLLLPETQKNEAISMAERIRIGVQEVAFELPNNSGIINITVSIGVTVYSDAKEDIKVAIKKADTALYEAKNNGRNQVVFMSE